MTDKWRVSKILFVIIMYSQYPLQSLNWAYLEKEIKILEKRYLNYTENDCMVTSNFLLTSPLTYYTLKGLPLPRTNLVSLKFPQVFKINKPCIRAIYKAWNIHHKKILMSRSWPEDIPFGNTPYVTKLIVFRQNDRGIPEIMK